VYVALDEGPVETVGWGRFALPGERKWLREKEAARLAEMRELQDERHSGKPSVTNGPSRNIVSLHSDKFVSPREDPRSDIDDFFDIDDSLDEALSSPRYGELRRLQRGFALPAMMVDGGYGGSGPVHERILVEKIVLVETPPEFVERYGKEVYVKLQLRPEEWRSRLAVRLEAKKFLQERPPLTSSELPKWARYEMLTRNIRSLLKNPLSYMRFKASRRQRSD
jgi:hypothetical protein